LKTFNITVVDYAEPDTATNGSGDLGGLGGQGGLGGTGGLGGLGGGDCIGCPQDHSCGQDQARIEELRALLDDSLYDEEPKTVQYKSFEKCQEQLVMGTNLFMSFLMMDGTYTHVKYYQSLFSDDWEIVCKQEDMGYDSDFDYYCGYR